MQVLDGGVKVKERINAVRIFLSCCLDRLRIFQYGLSCRLNIVKVIESIISIGARLFPLLFCSRLLGEIVKPIFNRFCLDRLLLHGRVYIMLLVFRLLERFSCFCVCEIIETVIFID